MNKLNATLERWIMTSQLRSVYNPEEKRHYTLEESEELIDRNLKMGREEILVFCKRSDTGKYVFVPVYQMHDDESLRTYSTMSHCLDRFKKFHKDAALMLEYGVAKPTKIVMTLIEE